MSTQRRGVALTPMETRYDIILRTAQLADELGYEAFALPEGWGLDATRGSMTSASCTRPTSCARQRSRSARSWPVNAPYSTPRLGHGRSRLGQPAAPDLRIWLAAMGDRTVRAAELADGWFPLFVARDQVLDRVHTLRKDREAAALRTEPLTVVAGSRPSPPMTPPWLAASRPVASPGICPPWATSTPGSSPSRDTVARSRSSSKRTRIPVPMAALSPPRRRSSWTSSPPTVRQARSAISWRGGAARSTWR
jgi:alkanesulfonate monooxygenase SsuD/methylene tetrahydromethanopterin reductase-like flavin-dependent oxidoreductase (luciferase family)